MSREVKEYNNFMMFGNFQKPNDIDWFKLGSNLEKLRDEWDYGSIVTKESRILTIIDEYSVLSISNSHFFIYQHSTEVKDFGKLYDIDVLKGHFRMNLYELSYQFGVSTSHLISVPFDLIPNFFINNDKDDAEIINDLNRIRMGKIGKGISLNATHPYLTERQETPTYNLEVTQSADYSLTILNTPEFVFTLSTKDIYDVVDEIKRVRYVG